MPDVKAIVNANDSSNAAGQWHNFMQGVQKSIESGQPIGGAIPVSAGDGVLLGQCIKTCIKRLISSTNGNVTITANPQVSAGFDGQEITLEGSDNVKSVTLSNGAPIILKNGDVIKLHYNESRKMWIENYRSINS